MEEGDTDTERKDAMLQLSQNVLFIPTFIEQYPYQRLGSVIIKAKCSLVAAAKNYA